MKMENGHRVVGYVRISTNEKKQVHSLDAQERSIREYCKWKGWNLIELKRDNGSGKSLRRRGLQELLRRKNEWDTLVVCKIDRLARNLYDLLGLIRHDLAGKNVVFIEQGIDLSTSMGQMVFQVLGSIAEWERKEISSRIKVGLAEARRKGKRLGGKPRYPEYREQVHRMRGDGWSWRRISRELRIDAKTAKRAYFETSNVNSAPPSNPSILEENVNVTPRLPQLHQSALDHAPESL